MTPASKSSHGNYEARTQGHAKNLTKIAQVMSLSPVDLFRHPGRSTMTGKIDKAGHAKLAALPFVAPPKRGSKDRRCFWSATASGDYCKDLEVGKSWAQLFIPFLKYEGGPATLSHIAVGHDRGGRSQRTCHRLHTRDR
jgi:hypothetical protein